MSADEIRIPDRFPSTHDLTDKVALVTGGSRGLGLLVALAFAHAGACVAVASRTPEQVERAAKRIAEVGVESLGIVADTSSEESTEAMVAAVVERWGSIDVLVNNAGISPVVASAEQLCLDDWRQIIDVNLTGAFLAARAAGRAMIAGGKGGRIVNTASVTGQVGFRKIAAYSASKGGVIALTRTLAIDWAPYNILVNAVAPGWFDSPLASGLRDHPHYGPRIVGATPLGRWGASEDLAGMYVFLASDAASFVTGQVFAVDGGYSAI
jgi:NAD(P)-dependent dehydrogenase (short-subunit alcohol dehydrogenase family)